MGLIVYSEIGCQGEQKELVENVVDLGLAGQVGVTFTIKSAAVSGNPWLLYGEDRYQKFLLCAEEGRYEDLTGLGRIVSVKVKNMKYRLPHITLYNSSTFRDLGMWWTVAEGGMKTISVGESGLWAISSDNKIFYREGTGYGKGLEGTRWLKVDGTAQQLSVGYGIVWAVNGENGVMVRRQLSKDSPVGVEWLALDGIMKMCSVDSTGICWAVDTRNNVFRRSGAKRNNPIGNKWQAISGEVKHITVGRAGVWAITPDYQVLYRDKTFATEDETEGLGWSKVDGRMAWLSAGDSIVWGVSLHGNIFYRAGITAATPTGSNWFKLFLGPDQDVAWLQLESYRDQLIGMDKEGAIIGKERAGLNNIQEGNSVNVYEGMENFRVFNVAERPATCAVMTGGWVVFSQPSYRGAQMLHFDDENICQDLASYSDERFKIWEEPIGSVRPIVGQDYRSTELSVWVNWDQVTTTIQDIVLKTYEHSNPSEDFVLPKWKLIEAMEVGINHRFRLSQKVPECIFSMFTVSELPRNNITVTGQGMGKFDTKPEFRQELGDEFTFVDGQEARRLRQRTENVRLSPKVPPLTHTKVTLVCRKGTITAPFVAKFRQGLRSWSVEGVYTGEDSTNIKVLFQDAIIA